MQFLVAIRASSGHKVRDLAGSSLFYGARFDHVDRPTSSQGYAISSLAFDLVHDGAGAVSVVGGQSFDTTHDGNGTPADTTDRVDPGAPLLGTYSLNRRNAAYSDSLEEHRGAFLDRGDFYFAIPFDGGGIGFGFGLPATHSLQ